MLRTNAQVADRINRDILKGNLRRLILCLLLSDLADAAAGCSCPTEGLVSRRRHLIQEPEPIKLRDHLPRKERSYEEGVRRERKVILRHDQALTFVKKRFVNSPHPPPLSY